jgi:hypothetical protein
MTGMDDITITETDVAGSLFDPATMEELKRQHEVGLWFWSWETGDWRRDWPGYRGGLWG